MINRTITLPEEINEKLKYEENASGLITELLTKYYNVKIEEKKTLQDREKEIEEARIQFLLKYEEDKKKLKEKLELERARELTEQQKIERKQNQKIEMIKSIQGFVKYLINRELTDAELQDYLIGLENGLYVNVASFLEKKGIEEKQDD